MIRREEVYKIGLLNKPHGIHGELAFTFTDDIFDRMEADYIICQMDGILVPFYIEDYRFRSDSTALIKLEGIDTTEQARAFTNVEVYFPIHHADEVPADELTWQYFVGFRMEEVHHGYLGEVTDVDTTTVNTLFVVQPETETNELLIPAREEFILGIDKEHRVITVSLPEGLLTLNQSNNDEEKEDEEEEA
jgi:16S rRNA processing protein RimM